MEDENKQDVDTNATTPEDQEVDALLKALTEDDDQNEDGEKPENNSEKSPENPDKPFKVLGNRTFKTEEEYDAWAAKNSGEVSRLLGELKIAQEKLAAKPTAQAVTDVNSLRMQIKVADFFEENPEAEEVKPIMAALLKSGKATDLKDAMLKAYKAVGKEVEEKSDDNDTKQLLKSGGSSGSVGDGAYKNKSEITNASSFASDLLSGRI